MSEDLVGTFVEKTYRAAALNMTAATVVLAGAYWFTGWAIVLLLCLVVAGLALSAILTAVGVLNRAKPLISFILLGGAAFTLVDGVWTVVFCAVGVFMGMAAFSRKNTGI